MSIKKGRFTVENLENVQINIGSIVSSGKAEEKEKPEGLTPAPEIHELRDWDLKLLDRYEATYSPVCDMCCYCTYGKCDLTGNKEGACGIDMEAHQAREAMLKTLTGAAAHSGHGRHLLNNLIERFGTDHPIDVGPSNLKAPLTQTIMGIKPETIGDFVPVMDYIDTLSENEYVVYVMVRDRGGRVRAHSDLNKIDKVVTDPALDVIYSDKAYIGTSQSEGEESIYDIAIPVIVGGEAVGVAQIGYSLKSLEVSMAKARNQIIAISTVGTFIWLLFAFLFAQLLTKPIAKLRDATIEVGKGNLNTRIEVESTDEIGELAASFQKMTEELQKKTVSKDYVDNILKSMVDALVVMTPKGKIETVNQAACDLLGYKPEELVGKPVSILYAKGEDSPFKGTELDLGGKDFVSNVERTYLSKDLSIQEILLRPGPGKETRPVNFSLGDEKLSINLDGAIARTCGSDTGFPPDVIPLQSGARVVREGPSSTS